jgi:uncharacterized protein (DUF433 family)
MILDTQIAEPPPLRIAEGGAVRVGATRVSLDTVIVAFQNGCTAEEIVIKYPTLELVDVYAVITYYLRHREEVDAYLDQRRVEAAELREKIEARFPRDGIRERLLARRCQQP